MLRLLGLASITVSFLAASSAPTPLYPTYQADWGFSAVTTTVVFGVYPLARPDQRAGVLSLLFTVSYVGLGVPAVAAGFAVAKGRGLVATSDVYGVAVIVLAALAVGNLIRLSLDNRTLTATP